LYCILLYIYIPQLLTFLDPSPSLPVVLVFDGDLFAKENGCAPTQWSITRVSFCRSIVSIKSGIANGIFCLGRRPKRLKTYRILNINHIMGKHHVSCLVHQTYRPHKTNALTRYFHPPFLSTTSLKMDPSIIQHRGIFCVTYPLVI
jgi:hypothetical protein